MVEGRVASLTEALFALEEPWQGRFLTLVANLSTNWTWNGRRPEQKLDVERTAAGAEGGDGLVEG
jgi:hypothetical protein